MFEGFRCAADVHIAFLHKHKRCEGATGRLAACSAVAVRHDRHIAVGFERDGAAEAFSGKFGHFLLFVSVIFEELTLRIGVVSCQQAGS